MSYRLAIIGGGNMGSAIVRGCLGARVFGPRDIIVVEIDGSKRRAMEQLGCATTVDPVQASGADQIVLAVKPQVFAELARAIGALPESKIVISIMAGLQSGSIRSGLGGKARIVRAMPNVACQIGAGMTAIALGVGAQRGDEALALSIFGALGKTVMLDESLMHAATAVSGSGPAYVFLLAEAMEQAAIELGIDQPHARAMVSQTVLGAGRLLTESHQGPEQLRASVTSPGGTTAAAMEIFQSRMFQQMVVEALRAARDRGGELDQRSSGSASKIAPDE